MAACAVCDRQVMGFWIKDNGFCSKPCMDAYHALGRKVPHHSHPVERSYLEISYDKAFELAIYFLEQYQNDCRMAYSLPGGRFVPREQEASWIHCAIIGADITSFAALAESLVQEFRRKAKSSLPF